MQDKIKKGRGINPPILNGEKNGNAKLTENQIKEIREKYQIENYSYRDLGKMYNTPYTNIRNIIKKRTWKYIT